MSNVYGGPGAGSASAAADPNLFARLMAYINGGGSPVPAALQSGGPPIPPNSGLTGPPPGPVQPGGGSSGGAGASAAIDQSTGIGQGPFAGRPDMPPSVGVGQGPFAGRPMPNAPMPPPRPSPVAGGGGVGGGGAIPAGATASVPTATPGMPGMIDRMNASAQMGQPARGYQTAGDFSRFFGMPSDVNPPANPTAPVRGGVLSKDGLSKVGKMIPGRMGPFTEDQIAGQGLKQRYT